MDAVIGPEERASIVQGAESARAQTRSLARADVRDPVGALGGAVGDPGLLPGDAVEVAEDRTPAANGDKIAGGRAEAWARPEIRHHARALGGAVGDPGLSAIDAVVGHEDRPTSAKRSEARRRASREARLALVDVGDQVGALGGAVGDPGFIAMDRIGRREERAPVAEADDALWAAEAINVAATAARPEVRQQIGAVRGAVGGPEFAAAVAVVGKENELYHA